MNKLNIFIDSDIILDVLLERDEFFQDSAKILDLSEQNKIKLFTSVVSITNIAYILKKEFKNHKIVHDLIKTIFKILTALPVTEEIILKSMQTEFNDFEDSIQYITAKQNGINLLITRNKKDYKTAKIKIYTPKEFLELKYF